MPYSTSTYWGIPRKYNDSLVWSLPLTNSSLNQQIGADLSFNCWKNWRISSGPTNVAEHSQSWKLIWPMLMSYHRLEEGETMYMYLVVTKHVVSAVLIRVKCVKHFFYFAMTSVSAITWVKINFGFFFGQCEMVEKC